MGEVEERFRSCIWRVEAVEHVPMVLCSSCPVLNECQTNFKYPLLVSVMKPFPKLYSATSSLFAKARR
jgi:hypothetical protein